MSLFLADFVAEIRMTGLGGSQAHLVNARSARIWPRQPTSSFVATEAAAQMAGQQAPLSRLNSPPGSMPPLSRQKKRRRAGSTKPRSITRSLRLWESACVTTLGARTSRVLARGRCLCSGASAKPFDVGLQCRLLADFVAKVGSCGMTNFSQKQEARSNRRFE